MNRLLQRIIRGGWRRISKPWIEVYNYFFNRPIGYVYMFHMVRPKEDYGAVFDTLRVSPEFFEKFLTEKKEQMDFVSVDEMVERMHTHRKGQKPFGVVTFDDGYDDNFIYAYPILKRLQIPFAIYVTVNFIDEGQRIWNYPLIIERMIRDNEKLVLGNGETYICATEEEKNKTYDRLFREMFFSIPYEQIPSEFQRIFGAYLTDDVFPKNTLTWEQIDELAKDPLCTIGSHTMTHCRMIMNDEKALSYELKDSKEILSERVGYPVLHLTCPNGWGTKRARKYAKSIGYKTIFRTAGPIREHDNEMDYLPRIGVHE